MGHQAMKKLKKKDSTIASKEKEVAAKPKTKGKAVATEETETPNWYGS